MSPSSSKLPSKPDYVSRDETASAEFDRICSELRRLPYLVESEEEPIAEPAMLYSDIKQLGDCLERLGRGPDTQGTADDLAEVVEAYRFRMREMEIPPGPLAQVRSLE